MTEPERPPSPVEQAVRKWLEESGFPLEMRTAALLRSKKFQVTQSDYFVDPESGKHREVDVMGDLLLGIKEGDEDWDLGFRLHLLASCKSNRKKPWVAFTSSTGRRKQLDEHYLFVNRPTANILTNLDRIPSLSAPSFFLGQERLAYGVTVSQTGDGDDRRDIAFETAMALAKVAALRLHEASMTGTSEHPMSVNAAERAHRDAMTRHWCILVLPVIVVDGTVCEARLGPSGAVEVEEVGFVRWLWRSKLAQRESIYIDVVTEPHLGLYLDGLLTELKIICDACRENKGLYRHPMITYQQDMLGRFRNSEESEDG